MNNFLCVVLTFIAAFFILKPWLFKVKSFSQAKNLNTDEEENLKRLLEDINHEFELGKITEEEFEITKKELQQQ
jgi:uncharacterized membrane protein